jgi:hypothetical protein
MLNWWNSMLPAQQILALIAMPSTLILIIQTVMVLIGFGDSGDGGDVDAITASTITSRAYTEGVALAVKVFNAIAQTPMPLN